jgi:hypothetical protein
MGDSPTKMTSAKRLKVSIVLAAIALLALAYAQVSAPRIQYTAVPSEEDTFHTVSVTTSCSLFDRSFRAVCDGARSVFWGEAVAILCAATGAWIFVPKSGAH